MHNMFIYLSFHLCKHLESIRVSTTQLKRNFCSCFGWSQVSLEGSLRGFHKIQVTRKRTYFGFSHQNCVMIEKDSL